MSVPYGDTYGTSLPTWLASVTQIFNDVPFHLWAAIAWEESSFNPIARNTGSPGHPEDSVGLFALNRLNGQGAGYSVAQLQNPITNATIAHADIAAAYKQYGDDPVQVAIHSGHPGLVDPSNKLVQNIARTSNWLKAAGDPMTAIQELLKGVTLPAVIPGLGPIDPTSIGSGIWTGLTSGISSWWASLKSKTVDELIDELAPSVMLFAGINAVAFGVLLAALQSKPAQAAARAASTSGNPLVAVGGAGVQAVGGDTAAPVRATIGSIRQARKGATA